MAEDVATAHNRQKIVRRWGKLKQIVPPRAVDHAHLSANEQRKLGKEDPLQKELEVLKAQSDDELTCRICFGEDVRANLIVPCACRGSVKFVHAGCLREWISRTASSESRHTCPQCTSNYELLRGASARRRQYARACLAILAFFSQSLLLASWLPWYARCVQSPGLWSEWSKRELFFLPPTLIDRIEDLNWVAEQPSTRLSFLNLLKGEDVGDAHLFGNCSRKGPWHFDAAFVYGAVKASALGFNLFAFYKILIGIVERELLVLPFLVVDLVVQRFGIDVDDVVQYVNFGIAFYYWCCFSNCMGYMPSADDSLVCWIAIEILGLVWSLRALCDGLVNMEFFLMSRFGGLQADDMRILDREHHTYH